jgi:hypothetical protein
MPPRTQKKLTSKQVGLKYGFRSGLEERTAAHLERRKVPFTYEMVVAPFVQPAKPRKYTPDFVIRGWLVIETKGRLLTEDRQKLRLIKQLYPDLDIRLVFSNPNAKLNKRSQTTYADWADKNGFPWAKESIPESWFDEPVNQASKEVIQKYLIHKDKTP